MQEIEKKHQECVQKHSQICAEIGFYNCEVDRLTASIEDLKIKQKNALVDLNNASKELKKAQSQTATTDQAVS